MINVCELMTLVMMSELSTLLIQNWLKWQFVKRAQSRRKLLLSVMNHVLFELGKYCRSGQRRVSHALPGEKLAGTTLFFQAGCIADRLLHL